MKVLTAPETEPLQETQAPALKRSYRSWKWLVIIALAALLLFLAFRGVDWRRVGTIIAHCRYRYLAIGCSCAVAAYVLRAMRWRVLLSAREVLPATTVFYASSVGYLANNYLPARAGELARSGVISSRSHLSTTYVFTTAIAERVVELIVLVFMAFAMSLTLAQRPSWLIEIMSIVVIGTILGGGFLLSLPAIDRARSGLIARIPVRPGWQKKLHHAAESVTLGIGALRSPYRLATLCALTVVVWTLDAGSNMALAPAVGMRLPFAGALLLSTGLAVGNALPSTPGAIGIFQFVAVTVLAPFHFTHTDAIAYILVGQAAMYVVVTGLGVLGIWGLSRARNGNH